VKSPYREHPDAKIETGLLNLINEPLLREGKPKLGRNGFDFDSLFPDSQRFPNARRLILLTPERIELEFPTSYVSCQSYKIRNSGVIG
jgi:hypothetical protein